MNKNLRIALCVSNENGETIKLPEKMSALKLQSNLDILIADTFSEIVCSQQSIADEETKACEKFNFALFLQNYLKEFKSNV